MLNFMLEELPFDELTFGFDDAFELVKRVNSIR